MREMADESWNPAGDEKLHVTFRLEPLKDEAASREQGRPIFKEVEFIKIAVPGQKTEIVERVVREKDRERFARQYDRWKRNGEQEALIGTPLAEWPGITRSQVEELKHFNVRSVEQLANLSDGNAQKFPGIQALKAKAKDYLEKAKGNAPLEKMRAELSERDNQIEALRRQLLEQGEAIEKLTKKKQ